MMDHLIFAVLVLWIAFDIFTLATAWYMVATFAPMFPGFWRKHAVADDPNE